MINNDTGGQAGSSYTASGTTATVLPGSGGFLGAGPGDEISVIVFGATNPGTAGAKTASLSTTSDPKAVSAGYTLTAKTSVSDDILQLSSRTGGAPNVTWSLTFATTNGLVSATNSGSTITVTFPAGTGMPPNEDVVLANNTAGTDCGGVLTSSGDHGDRGGQHRKLPAGKRGGRRVHAHRPRGHEPAEPERQVGDSGDQFGPAAGDHGGAVTGPVSASCRSSRAPWAGTGPGRGG